MSEWDKYKLQLKVVEKKVPFREGEDKVMYCLKPKSAHPLAFGDKVVKRMCKYGIPKGWAQLAVTAMSETMVELLSEGHAVNIDEIGTFRLSVNSKAHTSPADCSLSDVRKRKLQFYPAKEMQTFLKNCSFQISGQRKFVEDWEKRKQKG